MISNANPWDNLKFDLEGVAEVKRKFFGTLYNTYSFFSLYANLDQFSYSEEEVPMEERPEIDRWILSELNTLIEKVDEAYNQYEPTRATRLISDFVQEHLSNWYVRLCRRRFWKGAYETDKIAAYQTLYTCLETVALLSAPVAPFFMDRLYRDLSSVCRTNAAESVHLAEFPKADRSLIDSSLEQKMELAQRISSLVLSLRQKEKIKVRQPLQKIMVPYHNEAEKQAILAVENLVKAEVNIKEVQLITDEDGILVKQIKPNFKTLGPKHGKQMKQIAAVIAGFTAEDIAEIESNGVKNIAVSDQNIALNIEDVMISSQDIEGCLVASEGNVTVALDIHITPELKGEGIAREMVNRIQNLRKDSGFEVTDKIIVTILKDGIVEKAINVNLDYIKTETLSEEIHCVDELKEGVEIEFDDTRTRLFIQKKE
jgi:isoleucyl-tRNA synthetase